MNQGVSLTVEYMHGDMSVVEVYKSKVKVHEDRGFGPEGVREDLHFLDSSNLEEVLVMGKPTRGQLKEAVAEGMSLAFATIKLSKVDIAREQDHSTLFVLVQKVKEDAFIFVMKGFRHLVAIRDHLNARYE